MHKLTSTAAASMLWLAVLSIIQLARCDDAQIASLNLQASQDGALPPAVPRSSLFYQLVRDAVQKLHPGVLQANSQSHRHLVLAKELEPYVVQGFLMHNYSESDALVSAPHRGKTPESATVKLRIVTALLPVTCRAQLRDMAAP